MKVYKELDGFTVLSEALRLIANYTNQKGHAPTCIEMSNSEWQAIEHYFNWYDCDNTRETMLFGLKVKIV